MPFRFADKAIEKARQKISEVKTELQKSVETKQQSLDDLIDEMAKAILEDNTLYLGKDVTDKAIEKIEEDKKVEKQKKAVEEEKNNLKKAKKTVRISQENARKSVENNKNTEEGGE